jgi:hypothetical protein
MQILTVIDSFQPESLRRLRAGKQTPLQKSTSSAKTGKR